MSNKKILIADDEQDILDFLEITFSQNGFKVCTAKDGIQVLKKIKDFTPDISLLDLKMPNLEGDSLCVHLRNMPEYHKVPIVILTSQNNEEAEMRAFNAGANDFIAKPIRPQSLITRVKKALAQTTDKKEENNLGSRITNVGAFQIIHDEYKVAFNDVAIHFPRKEFQIIELLASKPGRVFERKDLFRKIWGENLTMDDRTIDVHIRKIRAKTADDFIKTVKGVGFKI